MDWEGAIRNLGEQGKVGVCVPAALKDAGIPVPTEYFTRALAGAMDVIKVAEELGYTSQETEGMDLNSLFRNLDGLKAKGQYPLSRIDQPSSLGVLAQHVNAVIGKTDIEQQHALVLGGIPPFGKE